MQFKITRWAEERAPNVTILSEKLRKENLDSYAWSSGPGDVFAVHSHMYNKVLYVVGGSITWILPETGERIETRAGDRIDLPAGTPHGAEMGSQGVVCLEAHC